MANSAPITVIRKTAMAMTKLLIRPPYTWVEAAAAIWAADSALCRPVALHQTASNRPFGRARPAKPVRAKHPLIPGAIITQLRASLDQEFAAPAAVYRLWAGATAGLPGRGWCYSCS
jgi:hypothetical protein